MPSRQDIEQFSQVLYQVGGEPEVLASLGQTLEPVEAPEEGLSSDLQALLGDLDGLDDSPATPETGDDSPFDFSGALDAGTDQPEPDEDGSEASAPDDFGGDFGGAELGDLGGLTDEPSPASDDLNADFGADLGSSLDATPDSSGVADDFGADFGGAELGDLGGMTDEPPAAPDDFSATPDSSGVADDFGADFGGAELGDLGALTDEPPAAPDDFNADFDATPGGTGAADDFDASFGDLGGLTDEPPAAPDDFNTDFDAAPDSPGAADDFSVTAPSGGGLDDLGDLSFDKDSDEFGGTDDFSMPAGFEQSFTERPPAAESTKPTKAPPPPEPDSDEPEVPDELSEEEPGLPDIQAGDEFSLGDFGAEFGLMDEGKKGKPSDEDLNPALNIPSGANEYVEAASASEANSITEADFKKLKQTLGMLPRNLKLAIEEAIGGNKISPDDQMKLITSLIKGESPRALASMTGRFTGKTIKIPRSYELLTGEQFESQQNSLGYIFRERILPVLQIALVSLIALGTLAFVGYNFVYIPIRAQMTYQEGYDLIANEDAFAKGKQRFEEACRLWLDKNWFFRYAELFVIKRSYSLAADKYEQLLARYGVVINRQNPAIRSHFVAEPQPRDATFEKAILDYSAMESEIRADYAKADRIIAVLLFEDLYDLFGLLARGDNFMRWAEIDPTKYESAREQYALVLEAHGTKPEYFFRMLTYFIRTDNLIEALRIKAMFDQDPEFKVDAVRYAELGGYLINHKMWDEAKAVLDRTMGVDQSIPELFYQYSRYYNFIADNTAEERALKHALERYELPLDHPARRPYMSRRELFQYIDTYRRLGDVSFRIDRTLDSQKYYETGIVKYEDAINRNRLVLNKDLGELYNGLGKLFYYKTADYDGALREFELAERSLVDDPEMFYRMGWIHYRGQDYQKALERFVATSATRPNEPAVLMALANTHFMRGNYDSAQGTYEFLLSKLQDKRDLIHIFDPSSRSEHRALAYDLMRVFNNYGATLFAITRQRSSRGEFAGKALAQFTRATEMFTNYYRNPETDARSEVRDIAFLNLEYVLHYSRRGSAPGEGVQIYPGLARDFTDPNLQLSR